MMLTTADAVEAWLHDRGGMAEGLPLLRSMVKGGRVSANEIDVIKEYLANLDGTPLAVAEPVASAQRAKVQPDKMQPDKLQPDQEQAVTADSAGRPKKSGNLAVVVAVMVAALAATLVAVR